MTDTLPAWRKRCSPGSRKITKRGSRPIRCASKTVGGETRKKSRGCTHSRNYKTRRCRSKMQHERDMGRLRAKGASRTIGRAVGRLRDRPRHTYSEDGVDQTAYDDFSPAYESFPSPPSYVPFGH